MSIEVPASEYDGFGSLKSPGMKSFWIEVDKAIQKLDHDLISLKPRKASLSGKNQQEVISLKNTTPVKMKLPTQVRIQDLVKGGPQLLRPKVADIAKRSRASEASILRPGSRARLRALEAFGFLMLKYAFSHILETLFLLFLTSILTPKVDKNRALDFTSINLRHSDMLHLFFNLHGKVML